jgi:tetratricopeptide (TPR) repeat protein
MSRLLIQLTDLHSMKTLILSLSISIITIFSAFAQPTLGDWATRHRQTDNLFKQGQYEEAIIQYEYVLRGRLPFQGKKHRDIGATHNNTGVAYFFLGETDKAEKAYQKALDSLLPSLGARHIDVLTIQANIAFVEESKNNYKKAQKAFELCIQSKLPLVGSKHLDIADCREGLALALEGQEKHVEALEQMNLALEIRKEKLGENHTDVGASYAGLALILLSQDNFDKADKIDSKARKILAATQGQYLPNKNPVSKFRPAPAEILKAKSKSLRLP